MTTAERQHQTAHRLLADLSVSERRLELAGIDTALLEGGDGPPIVLLHGPLESGANWRWVMEDLIETHRVIAPDLPAHGSTGVPREGAEVQHALAWLAALIGRTCTAPPVLVGHVLGAAMGARFTIDSGDQIDRLVLVDSLGLGRFRPAPGFALGLARFSARPSERSYGRFMDRCAFDLEAMQQRMTRQGWEAFASHNIELARAPSAKDAGRLMRKVGVPRIPSEELARITVPTSLIWGRHDRANRLRIAEAASERYGWPLHVIEEAGSDPIHEQPEAFLRALYVALGRTVTASGRVT